jgi:hypothetical protein
MLGEKLVQLYERFSLERLEGESKKLVPKSKLGWITGPVLADMRQNGRDIECALEP